MFTIDTIIRQQVNSFNGEPTDYEEFRDRECFMTRLAVYVIDENLNKFIVLIPFNGCKPYIKLYS